MSVSLLRTFFVQVAAFTPQVAWGFSAVCPDVAELLAIVALRQIVG
jgi:hypothetical protein